MSHDEFERLADSSFEGRDDAPVRERIEALVTGDPELRGSWEALQAARTGLAGAGLTPGLTPGLTAALTFGMLDEPAVAKAVGTL